LSIVIFSDVPFPWPLHARTAVGQEKPKPTSRPPAGAIGCASPVRQHWPGSSGRWWCGPPQRLDPAQHELEITVADRKHQIPPDPLASPFHPAAPDGTFGKSRPQDHLGGELPAFEGPILSFLYRLSTSCHAPRLPDRAGGAKLQQSRGCCRAIRQEVNPCERTRCFLTNAVLFGQARTRLPTILFVRYPAVERSPRLYDVVALVSSGFRQT
jgi:hypothetical protein